MLNWIIACMNVLTEFCLVSNFKKIVDRFIWYFIRNQIFRTVSMRAERSYVARSFSQFTVQLKLRKPMLSYHFVLHVESLRCDFPFLVLME